MQAYEQDRFLGSFTIGEGTVFGDLRLSGENTRLQVFSDSPIPDFHPGTTLTGVSTDGVYLTLIDIRSSQSKTTHFGERGAKYESEFFPHYVVVGRHHLDLAAPCILELGFASTDAEAIFYDFDAFGSVWDSTPLMDLVLSEIRKIRPVEVGEFPRVSYFTGKLCIAEVVLATETVAAYHRPSFSSGGPGGVDMKNRIELTVRPHEPFVFEAAMRRMYDIGCFLSTAAGRKQGLKHIRLTISEDENGTPDPVYVHPSFGWKEDHLLEQTRPSPGDLPLDPIGRIDEFRTVLSDWVMRQPEWRMARSRYLNCLSQENDYSPDRLVAAANMFDILPKSASPLPADLPDDLLAVKAASLDLFRQLPMSVDRNAALSALGRLGHLSLPKKVAHRVSIVEQRLGHRFRDLQLVLSVAVKVRNFYVHGSRGELNLELVQPLSSFLTDALEFVFAASDLIEAGWNPAPWLNRSGGWGHSFSRFRYDYDDRLQRLKLALG